MTAEQSQERLPVEAWADGLPYLDSLQGRQMGRSKPGTGGEELELGGKFAEWVQKRPWLSR